MSTLISAVHEIEDIGDDRRHVEPDGREKESVVPSEESS